MKKKKNQKQKLEIKNILVIAICVLIAIIAGIYSGDVVVGGSLLATGLISSYLASVGKRANYVFGLANTLLIAFVAYKNNLFGSFAVNFLIFTPLEIYGYVSWSRNLDKNKNVKARKFTLKDSILVTGVCAAGSIALGYILTLIPGQQLAFFDSTISCVDICALILMNLRFRESWWLWMLSGALSIVVWTLALSSGGESAFMRLMAAIGFLISSTYGAIKWGLNKKAKVKKF